MKTHGLGLVGPTALLIAMASGCPAPSSPAPPGATRASIASTPARTQPHPAGPRVESVPPADEDLDEFDTRPGTQVKAWRYSGPRRDVRFTVSVDDRTREGRDNDSLMSLESGARIVFAVIPPLDSSDRTHARLSVKAEDSRSVARTILPELWHHWPDGYSLAVRSQSALTLGNDPEAPESVLYEVKAEEPQDAPGRFVVLRLRAVLVPPLVPPLETPEAPEPDRE
jgi:hypothetical protein